MMKKNCVGMVKNNLMMTTSSLSTSCIRQVSLLESSLYNSNASVGTSFNNNRNHPVSSNSLEFENMIKTNGQSQILMPSTNSFKSSSTILNNHFIHSNSFQQNSENNTLLVRRRKTSPNGVSGTLPQKAKFHRKTTHNLVALEHSTLYIPSATSATNSHEILVHNNRSLSAQTNGLTLDNLPSLPQHAIEQNQKALENLFSKRMGLLPFETFTEFGALIQLKYFHKLPTIDGKDESLKFCYDKLNQVSRSFAMVIQELPEELKHPVAIFYLVLRGLDTVEDDTEYLKENPEAKHELLRTFYQKIHDPSFHLENCGGSLNATAHYADLMLHFDHVCKIFLSLDQKYQAVIEDVTMKMGCGMVDYLGMTGVDTVKDYDEYCHYVAGLVGIGLSDMFAAFGEDKQALFKTGLSGSSEEPLKKSLSNLMGLFLQKVNIIRDYAEDIEEGRTFYPSSAFQQFGLTQVTDLKDPKNLPQALKTLNYLVTDALSHAPDCLEYMSSIKDPKVFSFCAIPQVMAIATLVEIYNNPNVFVKNVKIRKGLTARIFMETKNLGDVQKWFSKFAADLRVKLEKNMEDPSAQQTRQALDNIQKKAGEKTMKNGLKISSGFGLVSVITALVCYTLYGRSPSVASSRSGSIFGRLFGWTGLTPSGI